MNSVSLKITSLFQQNRILGSNGLEAKVWEISKEMQNFWWEVMRMQVMYFECLKHV